MLAPGPRVPIVARCIRGIEWICAAELAGLPGVRVERAGHRLVEAEARPGPELLGAATADDLFLLALPLAGAGRERSSLAALRDQCRSLRTDALLTTLQGIRPLPPNAPFEVVASFLGRRNYTRFEIERAVGEGLEQALGRRFVPGPIEADGHPPISFR